MQNQERLIDANLFRKRCEQRKTSGIPKSELLWILDHQPTVEAIRVVHGRWVLDEAWAGSNGGDRHVCSVCNDYYTLEANSLFYCPRCGAKMNEIEHPERHGYKMDFVDGKWKRVYGIIREAYVEMRN